MITKVQKVQNKLNKMKVNTSLDKVDIVNGIWGKGTGENHFIRRTFDVTLCRAKRNIADDENTSHKKFETTKSDKITRVA